jgi:hypothetical protein
LFGKIDFPFTQKPEIIEIYSDGFDKLFNSESNEATEAKQFDTLVDRFITVIMEKIVEDFNTKDFKSLGEYLNYGPFLEHIYSILEPSAIQFEVIAFAREVIRKHVGYLSRETMVSKLGCSEKEAFYGSLKRLLKPTALNVFPTSLKDTRSIGSTQNLIKITRSGSGKRGKSVSDTMVKVIHGTAKAFMGTVKPDKTENNIEGTWDNLVTKGLYSPLEYTSVLKNLIELYKGSVQKINNALTTGEDFELKSILSELKSNRVDNLLKIQTGCKYENAYQAKLNESISESLTLVGVGDKLADSIPAKSTSKGTPNGRKKNENTRPKASSQRPSYVEKTSSLKKFTTSSKRTSSLSLKQH